MTTTVTVITVNRTNVFQGVGRWRPFKWIYDCVGPDGTRFDNDSIVTLRQILKSRYPGVSVVEPWKAGA